jgi:N-acetyl-anhydromuramyl-L-alanine amidase AmpD
MTNRMIVKPIDIKIPKHCKPRPHVRPLGIVIHAMGQFVIDKGDHYAPNYLAKNERSAHAFVERNHIWEWIPENLTAYHAGVANNKSHSHKGQSQGGFTPINTYYLGPEILVEGHHNYSSFLEAIKKPYLIGDQYEILKKWVFNKMIAHSIPLTNIVRHSDISGKDVRPDDPKFDPGDGFPWGDFQSDLRTMIKEYFNDKKLVNYEKGF